LLQAEESRALSLGEIGDVASMVENTDKEIVGSEPSAEGSTDNIDSEALEPKVVHEVMGGFAQG
jgi:hypothetical protein